LCQRVRDPRVLQWLAVAGPVGRVLLGGARCGSHFSGRRVLSFPCFLLFAEGVFGAGFTVASDPSLFPFTVGNRAFLRVTGRGDPGLLLALANGHPSLLCLYRVPAGRDASTGVVGMIVREVILRGGLFLSPPRWAPPRGVLASSRVGRWVVRCC
jgi:hypothetical protein